MLPWLFLAASLVGAAFTTSALIRARHMGVLTAPWFLGSWLTGELALHHIAWQAVATLIFASFGALAAWPGIVGLALTFVSWGALLTVHARRLPSGAAVRAAFDGTGPQSAHALPLSRLVLPFRFAHTEVERVRNVPYGDVLPGDRGRRNLLDVYRPRVAGEHRPILVQIHGGGWVIGEKNQQGLPLMYHLAARDWVCFAPNYRLSPQATFPDQIVDVKRALAWVRAHAADYGGDPDFICITGGSAGGHLAALAALSPNDPAYQPGFEQDDTSVAACVPFYGVYDLLDRRGLRGSAAMAPFLEERVFKRSAEEHPEFWERASPISRIDAGAPPFLVIQGTHDTLVFVEEARAFVQALREKSRSPVLYLELPGAQHAFDVFHTLAGTHSVHAATDFLEQVRAEYGEKRGEGPDGTI